ncbi:MAG TPA: hypothetical protein VJA47_04060 [archaeon]|nr:hypothetical protein [archaeon]
MDKQEILGYLEERFGLDSGLFGGLEFLEESKGRVFITTKDVAKIVGGVRPVTVGLLFCRLGEHSIKLSSNITQLFGNKATKNIVFLSEVEAKKFIEGEDLEIQKTEATDGYVIVKHKDYPLGVGLLKEGAIKNMLPKAKRIKIEI